MLTSIKSGKDKIILTLAGYPRNETFQTLNRPKRICIRDEMLYIIKLYIQYTYLKGHHDNLPQIWIVKVGHVSVTERNAL